MGGKGLAVPRQLINLSWVRNSQSASCSCSLTSHNCDNEQDTLAKYARVSLISLYSRTWQRVHWVIQVRTHIGIYGLGLANMSSHSWSIIWEALTQEFGDAELSRAGPGTLRGKLCYICNTYRGNASRHEHNISLFHHHRTLKEMQHITCHQCCTCAGVLSQIRCSLPPYDEWARASCSYVNIPASIYVQFLWHQDISSCKRTGRNMAFIQN